MTTVQIKKQNNTRLNETDLQLLTKEELIQKIKALTAQNTQLKNVIAKSSITQQPYKKNKPFNFEKCIFRHILLKFLYLGWDYRGYAVQDDTINTIEHHLFEALTKTCLIKHRSESNYHRCGRTDKGVSSFGQVISIDVRSKLTAENQNKLSEEIDYCLVLNKVLPDDIKCIAWSPISESFSARFDCKQRCYKYFFPKANLDIDKMKVAGSYLLGTHDFRNFCKMDVGNGVVQFIRNVLFIDFQLFERHGDNTEYDIYVVTIKGQAFLWHQIRCIMGVLFLIGDGKESPEIVKKLLDVEANPRKPDYNMSSEVPLNLYECLYDNEDIKWYFSPESLSNVLRTLRMKWTFCVVKESMIKSMIDDLEKNLSCGDKIVDTPTDNVLLEGVKRKVYVPLLDRQKCSSLEDKIQHYAKRSRIQITENS